jgi:hypothetical protein
LSDAWIWYRIVVFDLVITSSGVAACSAVVTLPFLLGWRGL